MENILIIVSKNNLAKKNSPIRNIRHSNDSNRTMKNVFFYYQSFLRNVLSEIRILCLNITDVLTIILSNDDRKFVNIKLQ